MNSIARLFPPVQSPGAHRKGCQTGWGWKALEIGHWGGQGLEMGKGREWGRTGKEEWLVSWLPG